MNQIFEDKFNKAHNWLLNADFSPIYANHHLAEPREFHYIKDEIRVKLFISQIKESYYCQIVAPIDPYNLKDQPLQITSSKYGIGDNNLFIAHSLVKEKLSALNAINNIQEEHSKQTMWEYWFVISIILFLGSFFIGTLEGSKTFLPNWIYAMGLVTINLMTCLYYGLKTPK